MNKCIFGGQLAKDPTHGLKTKGGNPMVVLTIKMLRKNYEGKWVNDLIEVFAFGNYGRCIIKIICIVFLHIMPLFFCAVIIDNNNISITLFALFCNYSFNNILHEKYDYKLST